VTQITPAVEVDEQRLWFDGDPEWWADFRAKYTPTGRIRVESTGPDGDVVLVGMDGFNHAIEWMDWVQAHGIPKAAMRLRRIP
jgi:hypothetical protein